MRSAALIIGATFVALLTFGSTASAAVPDLGAVAANEVGSESALLEGSVNPNGLPTTYGFEYTTLAAFSESDFLGASASSVFAAGSGVVAKGVSVAIAGLAPDTTYFYRLVATNSSGTASGKASSFDTSHGIELACEGDDCQSLPPAPVDPTLTTLLTGLGNPAIRYHKLNHHKKPSQKKAKPRKPHKKKPRHSGGR
jgi:hypothetical protein